MECRGGEPGPVALLAPLTLLPPAQVKMAYVNFVNHCYVDTEVEMKEIYTSNHIWTLFENFTLDMARVCPPGGGAWACGRAVLGRGVVGSLGSLPGAGRGGAPRASLSPAPGVQ